MTTLTRRERDEILAQLAAIDQQLYPEPPAERPSGRAAAELRERYYQLLAEYADRLPRIVMSACPFTGEALEQSSFLIDRIVERG
jgi:hypothetical protein